MASHYCRGPGGVHPNGTNLKLDPPGKDRRPGSSFRNLTAAAWGGRIKRLMLFLLFFTAHRAEVILVTVMCDVAAEFSRRSVGKPEMDPEVNTGVHDLVGDL